MSDLVQSPVTGITRPHVATLTVVVSPEDITIKTPITIWIKSVEMAKIIFIKNSGFAILHDLVDPSSTVNIVPFLPQHCGPEILMRTGKILNYSVWTGKTRNFSDGKFQVQPGKIRTGTKTDTFRRDRPELSRLDRKYPRQFPVPV